MVRAAPAPTDALTAPRRGAQFDLEDVRPSTTVGAEPSSAADATVAMRVGTPTAFHDNEPVTDVEAALMVKLAEADPGKYPGEPA